MQTPSKVTMFSFPLAQLTATLFSRQPASPVNSLPMRQFLAATENPDHDVFLHSWLSQKLGIALTDGRLVDSPLMFARL